MKLMIDQHDIWNAIYNARNNRWHPLTSPNTAPATQNDCHDWSSSHMKRYLQCAEQQAASSNITKYCACHAKWFSKISETFLQNRWNVNYNARPIREWSELDPTMKPSSATRLATEVTFQDHHDLFVLKITTFRAPAIILNFTECCARHEKWQFNITKYCACHEKWHLNATKQCTWHEKSHYATLLFSSIRHYSLTNLFSNESNLLRISSHKNLISYESLLTRI